MTEAGSGHRLRLTSCHVEYGFGHGLLAFLVDHADPYHWIPDGFRRGIRVECEDDRDRCGSAGAIMKAGVSQDAPPVAPALTWPFALP